jgi:NitT/TauT family transport system substrate-binding protein
VRVILFRAAYNLPVTLGLERGVFARHGLDLDIAYTRGSQMVGAGLLGGEYELGVLSADDVIYEVETHGADLFMFMGLHAGILTLIARPEIRTARDVAGKRLGVDDPASGFALVAHTLLQSAGVARSEYETVSAGGHEHRARALLEGTVDVALLTPPFTLEAMALGFTVLARPREHLPAYQASAGVTTRRWARANTPTLVAYIRAYRESLAHALAVEHRTEAVDHLAREFALAREAAASTYSALADSIDGLFRDARIDIAGVQTALDLRVNAGLLAEEPRPLTRYYDTAYLDAAI